MSETFLGLTIGQLVMLSVVGTILLVILFTLSRMLKLTKTLVKLGCLAVIVLGVIVALAAWLVGR